MAFKKIVLFVFAFIAFCSLLSTSASAQCINTESGRCTKVTTSLGPISTDPAGLVGSILGILLSFSGGVAILLIIAGGYQLMTSQGNPEKVKEARERITSAIVGLLFVIFSVAILQFIGVTILQIPGFSR